MQGDWGSPTVDGRVPFGNGALRGLILALELTDQDDMSDVRIEPQVLYTLMQEIYELRDEFQVGSKSQGDCVVRSGQMSPAKRLLVDQKATRVRPEYVQVDQNTFR